MGRGPGYQQGLVLIKKDLEKEMDSKGEATKQSQMELMKKDLR